MTSLAHSGQAVMSSVFDRSESLLFKVKYLVVCVLLRLGFTAISTHVILCTQVASVTVVVKMHRRSTGRFYAPISRWVPLCPLWYTLGRALSRYIRHRSLLSYGRLRCLLLLTGGKTVYGTASSYRRLSRARSVRRVVRNAVVADLLKKSSRGGAGFCKGPRLRDNWLTWSGAGGNSRRVRSDLYVHELLHFGELGSLCVAKFARCWRRYMLCTMGTVQNSNLFIPARLGQAKRLRRSRGNRTSKHSTNVFGSIRTVARVRATVRPLLLSSVLSSLLWAVLQRPLKVRVVDCDAMAFGGSFSPVRAAGLYVRNFFRAIRLTGARRVVHDINVALYYGDATLLASFVARELRFRPNSLTFLRSLQPLLRALPTLHYNVVRGVSVTVSGRLSGRSLASTFTAKGANDPAQQEHALNNWAYAVALTYQGSFGVWAGVSLDNAASPRRYG